MKLIVDTKHYEDLSIKISDEEYEAGPASTIEEFCYALASFIVDFSKAKLGCNKETASSFKDLCLSCIDNLLNRADTLLLLIFTLIVLRSVTLWHEKVTFVC